MRKWLLTMTADLLNLDYVKRIEYDDDGQIVAIVDDGKWFLIEDVEGVDKHKAVIKDISNGIIDGDTVLITRSGAMKPWDVFVDEHER